MRLLAATIAAILLAPAAGAQTCPAQAPTETLAACLERTFGERAVLRLTGTRLVYELFLNPDTGTWTIVRTAPAGLSRVMTHGAGYTIPFALEAGMVPAKAVH